MLEKAINKLVSMGENVLRHITIEGRNYSNIGLIEIKKPTPGTLGVMTLTGPVDYLTSHAETISHFPGSAPAGKYFYFAYAAEPRTSSVRRVV